MNTALSVLALVVCLSFLVSEISAQRRWTCYPRLADCPRVACYNRCRYLRFDDGACIRSSSDCFRGRRHGYVCACYRARRTGAPTDAPQVLTEFTPAVGFQGEFSTQSSTVCFTTVPDYDTTTVTSPEVSDTTSETTSEATDTTSETTSEATDTTSETTSEATDTTSETISEATDTTSETTSEATDTTSETTSEATDTTSETTSEATDTTSETTSEATDTTTQQTAP